MQFLVTVEVELKWYLNTLDPELIQQYKRGKFHIIIM